METNKSRWDKLVGLALGATVVLGAATAEALTFNFGDTTGLDPLALTGFQAAADIWSSFLSDDVTVNLDIGFASLDPGTLAQAGSTSQVFLYSDIVTALSNDQASRDDAIAVTNLPGFSLGGLGEVFAFVGTEEDGSLEITDGILLPDQIENFSADNLYLNVNTANAKALGLLGNDGSVDAEITFNSDFTFDFDPSDGIDSDKTDFIGVATHEIGHALGFVSGVDRVDLNSLPGSLPNDLDSSAVFSVLDMFRYSELSVAAGELIGENVLDLAVGNGEVTFEGNTFQREPYFSIDGGQTNMAYLFSTGRFNGDGQQASHWKDDEDLGLMDPTLGRGELGRVSPLDIMAFDVIGWDRAEVPEPTTWLGLLAVGGFLLRKRK